MDYATTLKTAAEQTIPPLAAKAAKLEKQRAAVADRIKNERDDLTRIHANIADHKGRAAEQLAKSTSAYQEFQGRLRRLILQCETAREALALLDTETRPAIERDLKAAKTELHRAVVSVVAAVRLGEQTGLSTWNC